MRKKIFSVFALLLFAAANVSAQYVDTYVSSFKQLEELLPTPNNYRTASGAPGHEYWQQRADYDMNIELDDENRRLFGTETITYYNQSPDELTYLWLQLDQNINDPNAAAFSSEASRFDRSSVNFKEAKEMLQKSFDGGFKIDYVRGKDGKPLKYTVNQTMMRVELPAPLKKGQTFTFSIKWWYNINDHKTLGGRSGYEYFPEDDNCLYEIAQFFPRMAVYDDVNGWQHKQFLGRGEFALTFGNYKVSVTAPSDHIVAATGVLQNPAAVMSSTQLKRMEAAKKSYNTPVVIATQEEAVEREKNKAKDKKTWIFKADNVRDFAFASSRKFIWDAMAVNAEGKESLAMSFYPKEGNPLWGKYSTEAVAHALKVYSKFTIPYPYPVAISVHGPVWGMEYPMICFNGGRPEPNGYYSERIKYAMISVIIHEVGHNFFPMIINSDERQWAWMDEGLNSFVQYLAEQEWERNYPSRRGPAYKITEYMALDKNLQVPIMTNPESIARLGDNAYGKPATALNILRETVMGRELFDYAFKEYARRWAFKHPSPADFFRTMEDASAVDLDWFWRGWFYSNEHVDISLNNVKSFVQFGATAAPEAQPRLLPELAYIADLRNEKDVPKTLVDLKPELVDDYTKKRQEAKENLAAGETQERKEPKNMTPEEKEFFDKGFYVYELEFENKGGLIMPIIVEFHFADGTKETKKMPAEIWKLDNKKVYKTFAFQKEVKTFVLDPNFETADTDTENNVFPRKKSSNRLELFKSRQ
jgi:hypothetical protein